LAEKELEGRTKGSKTMDFEDGLKILTMEEIYLKTMLKKNFSWYKTNYMTLYHLHLTQR
jgi:hypothetical protein